MKRRISTSKPKGKVVSNRLFGRVAIVTGGASGIGRAISIALAKEGSSVVVCDVNEEEATETANEIQAEGGVSIAVKTDVSSERDVKRLVARALSRFGRIDILVNDAGILRVTPLIDTTANEWDKVMAVNARGAFLCSKHVARHMVAQNRGKIVNISSNAGKAAFPNEPSYIASKHAIIGLTKSMALDLAPFRINVNAICPGEVDTGMYRAYIRREAQLTKRTDEEVLGEAIHSIPLGRLAEPKEIANIAVFLCSDDADYVTGQAINVDGGSVLSK